MKRRKPPKRSKPWRWAPSRSEREQKQARRLALHSQQGGRCAGCGGAFPLRLLDESHKVALGMGRSRWDADDPLNALDNLELRCRPCHQAWEEHVRHVSKVNRERLPGEEED